MIEIRVYTHAVRCVQEDGVGNRDDIVVVLWLVKRRAGRKSRWLLF